MSEFVDEVKEAIPAFVPVEIRRMFGGHGIFLEGVMFGLVADERPYLRAHALTVKEFANRDVSRFQYAKGGSLVGRSDYLALDKAPVMRRWAKMAYEAALQSRR